MYLRRQAISDFFAIARALATEPLLVALDEPAAGMNASETEGLRQLMCKIKGDGKTVLLIEHDVKLVMGLRDPVTVLDYLQSTLITVGKGVANSPAKRPMPT